MTKSFISYLRGKVVITYGAATVTHTVQYRPRRLTRYRACATFSRSVHFLLPSFCRRLHCDGRRQTTTMHARIKFSPPFGNSISKSLFFLALYREVKQSASNITLKRPNSCAMQFEENSIICATQANGFCIAKLPPHNH